MQSQVKKASGGFWRYLVTPAGQKLSFYAASTTTIGLFVVNFIPQTFGLSYLKDFFQCYQNGIAKSVPEPLLERVESAMSKLELPDIERFFIKPFTVFGFDLFSAGSTHFRYGAAIGIPVNYNYSSTNDINQNDIRFRDESIDWDSEHGRILKESIILTEDEQIFGLCKTILEMRTHRVLLNSLFPALSFLSVYTFGNILNRRLKLLERPRSLRMVMYSILGLFGLGTWSFMHDYNQVTDDANVDTKLSKLGPEFIQAGIGYYDKLLKKNIALRALIGDDTYTAKGNENYLLRQKSLPLTVRKSFFEMKLKELTNVEEVITEEI